MTRFIYRNVEDGLKVARERLPGTEHVARIDADNVDDMILAAYREGLRHAGERPHQVETYTAGEESIYDDSGGD